SRQLAAGGVRPADLEVHRDLPVDRARLHRGARLAGQRERDAPVDGPERRGVGPVRLTPPAGPPSDRAGPRAARPPPGRAGPPPGSEATHADPWAPVYSVSAGGGAPAAEIPSRFIFSWRV